MTAAKAKSSEQQPNYMDIEAVDVRIEPKTSVPMSKQGDDLSELNSPLDGKDALS